MKAICPVCNVEGSMEQRGSSIRFRHYIGFENGKRKYCYHTQRLMPSDAQYVRASIHGKPAITEFENPVLRRVEETTKELSGVGAFGGIWTRDHYLTKVTPHRARLRRQIMSLPPKQLR